MNGALVASRLLKNCRQPSGFGRRSERDQRQFFNSLLVCSLFLERHFEQAGIALSLSRAELLELLQHPNPHEIGLRAQELRSERWGRVASFAAVEHLSATPEAFCAACGAVPEQRPWATTPHERATDLHILHPPGVHADALLASIPKDSKSSDGIARTALVATATDWMWASDGDDAPLLAAAVQRGLHVLSDGVMPRVHPARGSDAADRWLSFWWTAADCGLRGHAALLYGPKHDSGSILDQLDRIVEIQEDTGVFLSVHPVVDPGDAFGGVQDGLLTEGDADLRAVAASRLGAVGIEHVTMLYNRFDLKLAHVALETGADDVMGHLSLEARDAQQDANHPDLSRDEMPAWLAEAGFTPRLRNASFEFVPVDPSTTGANA